MKVKVVKQLSPADELTLIEAENTRRVFGLHLKRCQTEPTAECLANIFAQLSADFRNKKLALSANKP